MALEAFRHVRAQHGPSENAPSKLGQICSIVPVLGKGLLLEIGFECVMLARSPTTRFYSVSHLRQPWKRNGDVGRFVADNVLEKVGFQEFAVSSFA